MAQLLIQKTILVIGGSGTGKSSLVNNLALVLRFRTLQEAEKGAKDFKLPIPVYTQFGNILITPRIDGNTKSDQASYRTKRPQICRIECGNVIINLIDTPGIADSEGGQIYDEHVKNITACMYQCKEIHCILVVLKSSDITLNSSLKYTLNLVLSCLGKTAAKLVSFAITHSTHNPNTGTASDVIQKYLNELSNNPGIRFTADNTYCFESSPLFHVLATQTGFCCDEVDRFLFKIAYNNNVQLQRNLLRNIFRNTMFRLHCYNILNVPTLIMAKQLEPALATLLPYLDTIDDEIKRELDLLEKELNTNDSQYCQEEPRLMQIQRWRLQIIMYIPGQCFKGAKNTFNAAFGKYKTGALHLRSASDIANAVGWVCRELVAIPKTYRKEGRECNEEVEEDPVVKRLMETINEERVKITRMQSQKSTLYHTFQTEKKMLLDLLSDLNAYLKEHAIVANSIAEPGFPEDSATGLSTGIEKLKINGQWNPTAKNIEPEELIGRLSAMEDLEHFGNEIKKLLLQCENFENIHFRVMDILVDPNIDLT